MTSRKARGTVADADRRTAFTGHKWVRWSRTLREGFLDTLAATCNVTEAAASIGVTPTSAYSLRRRDEAFAAAWQAALALGYQTLETQLVGHALGGGERGEALANGDPARPAVNVELAIKLLADHRGQAARGRPVGGPRPRMATREEVNEAIIRKLKVVEARLGLGE